MERSVEYKRCGIGAGEAVSQPVDAEIRDQRHIDKHLAKHHEQDREHEQLSRKSKARRTDRFGPRGGFIAHLAEPCCAIPAIAVYFARRSHFMMRRVRGIVKPWPK